MERAKAFSARAGAVVEKARNLVRLDAEDAYIRWEEAVKKVAQAHEAARAGARLAKATRDAVVGGQHDKIDDILTTEVIAAQAQSTYNEALFQQIVSLADLQRATAGGFDPVLTATPAKK